MTTTPLDYFDKTPGTLEQLVLGVITQKLINRDYVPQSLATDFTTNAIDYSVTCDSGDNGTINGFLSLSLTFPTVPFERQVLIDKNSYDLRVLSLNSLNIDTLSLPQKPLYPLKSTRPQLPLYLSQLVPDNILERRLMALCLHIRNYLNWIDRWNNLANFWQATVLSNTQYRSYPLAQIEADRDALLLELATRITYKPIPTNLKFEPAFIANNNLPATALDLIEYFGRDIGTVNSDPAEGNQSPLSSSLLEELSDSSNSSSRDFGGNQPDRPSEEPPEQPTLPDC